MATKYTDCKNDWFEMWDECRKGTMSCMLSNLKADLDNGYDWNGASCRQQRDMIYSYNKNYEETLDLFKTMTETEVDRWCFYDMKKRGDID